MGAGEIRWRKAGFNPRPPLLAGDPHAGQTPPLRARVSIRARHYWRAIRQPGAGQCSQAGFNPRPPLLAGDLVSALARSHAALFQSAPAITGGRSNRALRLSQHRDVSIRARHYWRAIRPGYTWPRPLIWFQSAPAITGGRSGHRCAICGRHRCFNPRPPLLAGDPDQRAALSKDTEVSIRARHYWRAILTPTTCCPASFSFNPRPPLLAGDPIARCA